MDYETALAIASKDLMVEDGEEDHYPAAILEDLTIETKLAWVFFYNTKEFIETGNINAALAGNGPIVVTKQDGKIHRYGSFPRLEKILESYR